MNSRTHSDTLGHKPDCPPLSDVGQTRPFIRGRVRPSDVRCPTIPHTTRKPPTASRFFPVTGGGRGRGEQSSSRAQFVFT